MAKQVVLQENPERTASILDDSVLEEYNESIQQYGEKFKQVLGKFGQSNLELTGSSPFMIIHLLNSGLFSEDTQLANMEDLESAILKDENFLKNQYTSFGLALRPVRDQSKYWLEDFLSSYDVIKSGDTYDPNDLLAKVLAEELSSRGIKLDRGKLIPFNVLKNQEDSDSHYGAIFRLNENATKNNILDLDQFKWKYSRDGGLASAELFGDRECGSIQADLAESEGSGRVVVVAGEATSKKILDRYLAKFRSERDEALEAIAGTKRYYEQKEASLRVK